LRDYSSDRERAFEAAAAQLEGLNTQVLSLDDVQSALLSDIRPSALMCVDDETAVKVLHIASAAGLQVPEDASIVGFDDDLRAISTYPELTTIHMPMDEMANQALSLVLQVVSNELADGPVQSPLTHLVVRGSTGPARS
jgi:DNA-binding LacI/PurR family transcriptional regulator